MLKNELQIFLITYNRKKKLQLTLDSLLGSPVADFDMIILDNASTDGTSEMLDDYAKKHKNITHIRHKTNIGGNANICRAFEMAASCGKKYAWILCDDDRYDWSNWDAVERAMTDDKDIICVADYVFPDEKSKKDAAYQVFQMTFVPATIFKTSLISGSVLMNMYDSVYTMFQQSCLTAKVINQNGSIFVLDKPIVFNGLQFEEAIDEKDVSYVRGTDNKDEVLARRKDTFWILGFCNIISLLKDKNLQKRCIEVAIPYKDIYWKWKYFYKAMFQHYFMYKKFQYFHEIFLALPKKRRFQLCLYWFKMSINNFIKFIFSIDKDKQGQKFVCLFGIKFVIKKTEK